MLSSISLITISAPGCIVKEYILDTYEFSFLFFVDFLFLDLENVNFGAPHFLQNEGTDSVGYMVLLPTNEHIVHS